MRAEPGDVDRRDDGADAPLTRLGPQRRTALEAHHDLLARVAHPGPHTLERGDITALLKAGWRAPEVFVAKGRDGDTDIWGVIIRPSQFDPSKKYPVI